MCSRVGLLVASGVVPPDLSSAWTEAKSMSSSLLVYSNVIVDAGELDLDGEDSIFAMLHTAYRDKRERLM